MCSFFAQRSRLKPSSNILASSPSIPSNGSLIPLSRIEICRRFSRAGSPRLQTSYLKSRSASSISSHIVSPFVRVDHARDNRIRRRIAMGSTLCKIFTFARNSLKSFLFRPLSRPSLQEHLLVRDRACKYPLLFRFPDLTRPSLQDRPKWTRRISDRLPTVWSGPAPSVFRGCVSRIRRGRHGIFSNTPLFLRPISSVSPPGFSDSPRRTPSFRAAISPFAPSGIPFLNSTSGFCFSDWARTNADKPGSRIFVSSQKPPVKLSGAFVTGGDTIVKNDGQEIRLDRIRGLSGWTIRRIVNFYRLVEKKAGCLCQFISAKPCQFISAL